MLPPPALSREPRAVPQQSQAGAGGTTGLEPSHIPGTCSLAQEGERRAHRSVPLGFAIGSHGHGARHELGRRGAAGAPRHRRREPRQDQLCHVRALHRAAAPGALHAGAGGGSPGSRAQREGKAWSTQPWNQVLRQTSAHGAGAASQLDKTPSCKLPRGKKLQAQPWRGSR